MNSVISLGTFFISVLYVSCIYDVLFLQQCLKMLQDGDDKFGELCQGCAGWELVDKVTTRPHCRLEEFVQDLK